MGTLYTPTYGIRYPDAAGAATPVDIQNLATDIDGVHFQADVARTAALSRPHAALYRSSSMGDLSVPKGTHTLGTFDTIVDDSTGTMASTVTNRITAPQTGLYLAYASMFFNPAAVISYIQPGIGRNGSTGGTDFEPRKVPAGAFVQTLRACTWGFFLLTAGDYVSMDIWWSGSPAGPYPANTLRLALWMVRTNP